MSERGRPWIQLKRQSGVVVQYACRIAAGGLNTPRTQASANTSVTVSQRPKGRRNDTGGYNFWPLQNLYKLARGGGLPEACAKPTMDPIGNTKAGDYVLATVRGQDEVVLVMKRDHIRLRVKLDVARRRGSSSSRSREYWTRRRWRGWRLRKLL